MLLIALNSTTISLKIILKITQIKSVSDTTTGNETGAMAA